MDKLIEPTIMQDFDDLSKDKKVSIRHRGCGGYLYFSDGGVWYPDAFVCNSCRVEWEYFTVSLMLPYQMEDTFVTEREPIYKLELVIGKKGHDGSTYYHTRPATAAERASYEKNPPNLQKL